MTAVTRTPPKQVPWYIKWFTYLFVWPLIGVATAGFGCCSLLCGLWDKSGKQQHAIARMWARTLLLIVLSPVEATGLENVPVGQAAVFASNHLSYYDTPVVFAKLPIQFRILAKQSLWPIPFVGWYLNRSGQVPIDSSSVRSAVAGLHRGVKTLESGLSLMLFPEGGRAEFGRMTPFHSGAAFMAIRAGVPLVPIALVGTYELLPIHTYHLTPQPLKMIVGPPIATTGLTTKDVDALTQRLFAVITELYTAHRVRAAEEVQV